MAQKEVASLIESQKKEKKRLRKKREKKAAPKDPGLKVSMNKDKLSLESIVEIYRRSDKECTMSFQ